MDQKTARFRCWLDVNDRHPQLFGECILPRDDDAMGFALNLQELQGKYVEIVITELKEQPPKKWEW